MKKSRERLSVSNLSISFYTRKEIIQAVYKVSFKLEKGEILGIVGESGSGKTVAMQSILNLLDKTGKIDEGSIFFNGEELVGISEKRLKKIRGAKICMIFQDAMTTLNPVLSIKTQMIESIRAHKSISYSRALEMSIESLGKVGIPKPRKNIEAYPHQFSGGMRQRVVIAMAMINQPDLVIADEPTTALDVTIQSQILFLTKKLCREHGTSLIWISHDLSVVAGLVDRICIMYSGRVVEQGTIGAVLDSPKHPYTKALIGSIPDKSSKGRRLFQIPGVTKLDLNQHIGCTFKNRCYKATTLCATEPSLSPISQFQDVACYYPES